MRLILLRHGDAEDHATTYEGDFKRRLTPEGIERMRAEAAGMRRLGMTFDVIVTSPLLRARETAEIVAQTLHLPAPVMDDRLGSGTFRAGRLQEILADHGQSGKVLLVGHQPDMSEIIHFLTGGMADVKRGGMATIDLDRPEPGQGILLSLLTPKMLIALAAE
jgi:phosphohistidine phosphatase